MPWWKWLMYCAIGLCMWWGIYELGRHVLPVPICDGAGSPGWYCK